MLRPGFPLRFELDPATPLPDASFALGVELTRVDEHAGESGPEPPEPPGPDEE